MKLAKSLVGQVDYGLLQFTPENTQYKQPKLQRVQHKPTSSNWKQRLGYVYVSRPESDSWAQVSTLLLAQQVLSGPVGGRSTQQLTLGIQQSVSTDRSQKITKSRLILLEV